MPVFTPDANNLASTNQGPSGIPDPNNPGYDTAGYLLGATRGANGQITIPNPQTGLTSTTNANPVATSQANPGGNPFATFAPTNPNGGNQNWQSQIGNVFGSLPGIPKAPPFSYDAFQAPAPFALPSADAVLNSDPGYGFRVGQGTQALQQSAAARGVLNTGGTLQNLVDYGQQAASQEYGNAADRALGTYNTNYNDSLQAWLANAGNAFNTYNTNYQTQYQNPYLAAMNQFNTKAGLQGQLFGQQFQTATA